MSGMVEKASKHQKELHEALEPLRVAINNFINGMAGIEVVTAALESWKVVRQSITDAENIGVVVGIDKWIVGLFPLSNDPDKDTGRSKPDTSKMN